MGKRPYRALLIGVGAMGEAWCRACLPPNLADGLVEVVGAVDVNPDRLPVAKETLGLTDDQLFTRASVAFDRVRADFAIIVTTPDRHEEIVDLALDHEMDILSEKPIADTLVGSCRIARKVAAAGRKMGVTMSHRFDQDKTTLRRALRDPGSGRLDYLVGRFTCDCRRFASWGKFRHEMPDALMVEGAVHHLDILADLAGAPCDTIYAQTWNPAWGEYAGDSQALVTMAFPNGVRASYEGAKTNAVGLNPWGQEYIRAECEAATLIMSRRSVERRRYDASRSWALAAEGAGEPVALIEQPKWANAWLTEQFVHWLDGGAPMETNVEDNLQSVALVFAGIESSRTGMPVKVQEMLASARQEAAG
jgi:predicted dehydrogenase